MSAEPWAGDAAMWRPSVTLAETVLWDVGTEASPGWGQRPAQGGASNRRGSSEDRVGDALKGFCCFAAGEGGHKIRPREKIFF